MMDLVNFACFKHNLRFSYDAQIQVDTGITV